MAAFPDIKAPEYGSENSSYFPQQISEFESGYVQTGRMFTRARARWTLYWKALSEADYQTLLTFFHANQGGSFTMDDPITKESKTWQFASDNLSGDPCVPGYREVSLLIQEM